VVDTRVNVVDKVVIEGFLQQRHRWCAGPTVVVTSHEDDIVFGLVVENACNPVLSECVATVVERPMRVRKKDRSA
jgi:hypothetical protein